MSDNAVVPATRKVFLPEKLKDSEREAFCVKLSEGILKGMEFREIISDLSEFEVWRHFSDTELVEAFVDSAKGFYKAEFVMDSLAVLARIVKDPKSKRHEVLKAIDKQAQILGMISKGPMVVVDRSQTANIRTDDLYMNNSRSKNESDTE